MTRANMVRVLMEKPADRQHPHGAQQNHRHRDGGDQRCPDILQEEEHDDKDQEDRLDQGLDHLFDGDLYKGGGVIGIDHLHCRAESIWTVPPSLP